MFGVKGECGSRWGIGKLAREGELSRSIYENQLILDFLCSSCSIGLIADPARGG